MTREEEIRKASREYAMNKSNENNTWFVDYKDIEEAFLEGAKWADEHPINVWHNVSEKPELNQYFLAQIGDNAFDTFIMSMDENKDWRKWSEGMNIKMWVHIDDLLPKGGEE